MDSNKQQNSEENVEPKPEQINPTSVQQSNGSHEKAEIAGKPGETVKPKSEAKSNQSADNEIDEALTKLTLNDSVEAEINSSAATSSSSSVASSSESGQHTQRLLPNREYAAVSSFYRVEDNEERKNSIIKNEKLYLKLPTAGNNSGWDADALHSKGSWPVDVKGTWFSVTPYKNYVGEIMTPTKTCYPVIGEKGNEYPQLSVPVQNFKLDECTLYLMKKDRNLSKFASSDHQLVLVHPTMEEPLEDWIKKNKGNNEIECLEWNNNEYLYRATDDTYQTPVYEKGQPFVAIFVPMNDGDQFVKLDKCWTDAWKNVEHLGTNYRNDQASKSNSAAS